jgi:ABC-type phosphate/phosphonate transport system permease subunit
MTTCTSTPKETPSNQERAPWWGSFKLLIVLVLFVLEGLSVSTLANARRHRGFHHQVHTATDLARDLLEHLKPTDYTAVVAARYPPSRMVVQKVPFHRTVTIEENTPDPQMQTMTVTVAWQAPVGMTYSVMLSTILSAVKYEATNHDA